MLVLEQGAKDRAEAMGLGQAVCLLAEPGLQTSTHVFGDMPLDKKVAAFNPQRFGSLCDLGQTCACLPTFSICLNGAFWQEMERVIRFCGTETTAPTLR
jgi:hypothetical protein